jgi:hypothetical protein
MPFAGSEAGKSPRGEKQATVLSGLPRGPYAWKTVNLEPAHNDSNRRFFLIEATADHPLSSVIFVLYFPPGKREDDTL